jgi:hypothetical protein
MITSEEVRKQIQATNEYLETNIDPFGSFEDYISQQEKVNELLELKNKQIRRLDEMIAYLRIEDDYNYKIARTRSIDISIQIEKLESELK